ncbi:hypothetical protein TIFTF001_032963 [Ficus carica]|uniref:Uncharacterized protein n=1 Tax=Ficus carica TaxID=3494 RepID=A0AA88J6H7_FICCA|nr:hypothetical protein TIFTF001_032963 [Ficus carica]
MILLRVLPSPWLVWVNMELIQLQPRSGECSLVRCLRGQIVGPVRAPPFGQCPVIRHNSVVRETQEFVYKGRCWMLGPAWAPPILVSARSWDLTPWSGNHGSLSARADVGFCSGTSNSG